MISVLTPTRGRPQALAESVDSLMDLAEEPSNVEVLAAVDPDDVEGYVRPLPALYDVWVSSVRHGYIGIHCYYNFLATHAAGDWLLIWNDDALMRTQGWDKIVESQAPAVLRPSANHHHELNLFPVWPTRWARHIGHVSLCFNADTWVQEVGNLLGGQQNIPVEIFHDRDNVTGSGKFADQTAAEGTLQSDQSCSVFNSPEMAAARQQDANRIREIL